MIMDELETNGTTSRITFWYGARTNEHIVYQEEFDALAAKYPNFSWHIVLSELADSDDWHGPRGMVHEVVRDDYLSSHPSLEQCAFYVCGPPLMLEAVLKLIQTVRQGWSEPPELLSFRPSLSSCPLSSYSARTGSTAPGSPKSRVCVLAWAIRYSAGNTSKVSSVDEKMPPITTVASGL